MKYLLCCKECNSHDKIIGAIMRAYGRRAVTSEITEKQRFAMNRKQCHRQR
jgi:hypothetical protein